MWDAPNQQVVRADESPPWEEGTGNGGAPDPQKTDAADEEPTLDEMTKAQLLKHAAGLGLDDVDDTMTKAEIREAIDDA